MCGVCAAYRRQARARACYARVSGAVVWRAAVYTGQATGRYAALKVVRYSGACARRRRAARRNAAVMPSARRHAVATRHVVGTEGGGGSSG